MGRFELIAAVLLFALVVAAVLTLRTFRRFLGSGPGSRLRPGPPEARPQPESGARDPWTGIPEHLEEARRLVSAIGEAGRRLYTGAGSKATLEETLGALRAALEEAAAGIAALRADFEPPDLESSDLGELLEALGMLERTWRQIEAAHPRPEVSDSSPGG